MPEIEEQYKSIFDNLYDGAYLVDRDRKITYWNRAAEKITGFSPQDVVGKDCASNILTHIDKEGNNLCKGLCPLVESMDRGETKQADLYLHHKKGHRIPVSVRVIPFRDKAGNIIGGMELFSENSPREAMLSRLQELEALALLDPVTRLANRHYLEQECRNRLQEFQRYGQAFGIIMLDIDQFKTVNDTYGHDTGDEILKAVAKTLATNFRPFDLFGRWGGDEFIGIISHVGKEDLTTICSRTRMLIENAYIIVGGNPLGITVSIGATTSREEDTLNSILKRADRLLYQSKAEGRNRINVE